MAYSPNDPQRLITIQEAALRCGVHKNTLRNWILEGKLKAVRIGARIVRIDPTELDALTTPYVGGEYSTWNRA